jgi:hypothetical protein
MVIPHLVCEHKAKSFNVTLTFRKLYMIHLNGTHQLLAYADAVNLLGDNIDTIKKNKETLIDASMEAKSRRMRWARIDYWWESQWERDH